MLKIIIAIVIICSTTSCWYSFKDVSIAPNIKTYKVNYIENKARYINPQLTAKITDKLRQKIISQTKLSPSNDNPNIEITGTVTDYSITTSGVNTATGASTNRLNIGLTIEIKNNVEPDKTVQSVVSRNFDFPSSQSFSEFENSRLDEVIRNVVDEIFNKIFSNW